MKKFNILFLLFISLSLSAQEHRESISKTFQLGTAPSDYKVIVANITGNIKVEGYNGKTVQLELEQSIDSQSKERIEQIRQEVSLGIIEQDKILFLYMKTPCTQNPSYNDEVSLWEMIGQNNCKWQPKCHVQFDFVLKVPRQVSLRLATINNGDIAVKNVQGDIDVDNINGSIALEKIAGSIQASTINGDLDITYSSNPNKASRYYTLNGDINAYYLKGLAAQLSFKSFNGDFYTNLDNLSVLPTKIKKEKIKKGEGISYKIGGQSAMQVRNGTVALDFETFNGNVYVREN